MTAATDAPSNSMTTGEHAMPAWATPLHDAYARAGGDRAAVPWDEGGPSPAVVGWLNTSASHLVRPGSRAIVVQCGMGDDVAELTARGYDAVGIDACPLAVEWARREHPDLSDRVLFADVTNPPLRLVRRFDLVVAPTCLGTIPPEQRADAARGIASLARPHGIVIVCCEAAEDAPGAAEIQGLFEEHGLLHAGETELIECGGRTRLRAVFHR